MAKRSWQGDGWLADIAILDTLTEEQADMVEKHVRRCGMDEWDKGYDVAKVEDSRVRERCVALAVAIVGVSAVPMSAHLGLAAALLSCVGGAVVGGLGIVGLMSVIVSADNRWG